MVSQPTRSRVEPGAEMSGNDQTVQQRKDEMLMERKKANGEW